MEKSETIGKLTEALAKAQAAFQPIKRAAKVDFTTRGGQKIKYSYATLQDVLDAVRPALSLNGLALTQPTKIVDGKVVVETLLSHSSGEWISGELFIESLDKTPQSEGSALTYARRYALSSLLGIASEEDDDAEAAMQPIKVATSPKEKHQETSLDFTQGKPIDRGDSGQARLTTDQDKPIDKAQGKPADSLSIRRRREIAVAYQLVKMGLKTGLQQTQYFNSQGLGRSQADVSLTTLTEEDLTRLEGMLGK